MPLPTVGGSNNTWGTELNNYLTITDQPYAYVDDYGAVGNGTTDDSAAIIAARNAVLATRVSNRPTKPVLLFGPKTYKIVSPDALWAAGSTRIDGYTIRGAGQHVTQILFAPVGGSSTLTNMNLITASGAGPQFFGLQIEDIEFKSSNANASFAYLYSTAAAWIQETTLKRVSFDGSWKRIIGLDGDSTANLNSEMVFDHISLAGATTFSDAFLRSGITTPGSNPNQDQFLNFWFKECMMEYDTGDLLVFDKGGHIHVWGGSYINNSGTFLKMGDYAHFAAVMTLTVDNVRFELRSTSSKVIDCAWRTGGHVTFKNCDDESQAFNYEIYRADGTSVAGTTNFETHTYRTPNHDGPIVRYQDCALMGYHRVVTTSTIPAAFKIIYQGSKFYNFRRGLVSTVAGATNQFLRYDSALPAYRFVDCAETVDAQNPNTDLGLMMRSSAIAESFPRSIGRVENLASALTSGQMIFSPMILRYGQVVTQIGFWAGTTALSAGSNQWFGLWNINRSKLGVTNDDTSTAWAANTEKLLTLATPYVVLSDGLYYVSIMVTATTVPSLLGLSTVGQLTIAAPTLNARDSTNTGLTNPASAPATATFSAAGSAPWAYVK